MATPRWLIVNDLIGENHGEHGLGGWLLRVKRIIVSHRDTIEGNAREPLRKLAARHDPREF